MPEELAHSVEQNPFGKPVKEFSALYGTVLFMTTTGPYPGLYEYSPLLPTFFCLRSLLTLPPPPLYHVLLTLLLFRLSDYNFVPIFPLTHASYMPRPCHLPLFDHRNNIR